MARELTTKQQLFLECLYDEDCKGDPVKAKVKAGYSPETSTRMLLKGLREELDELAITQMTGDMARAVLALRDVLERPTQLGGNTKMKAALEILNWGGMRKQGSGDLKLNVPEGGIVILPAKEAMEKYSTEENEEYETIEVDYEPVR